MAQAIHSAWALYTSTAKMGNPPLSCESEKSMKYVTAAESAVITMRKGHMRNLLCRVQRVA